MDQATRAFFVMLDQAILLIWGGLAAFFISRYIRHRKLISLAIASMAVGWFLLPFWEQAGFTLRWLKVLGAVIGLFMWYALYKIERESRDAEPKKKGSEVSPGAQARRRDTPVDRP